MERSLLVNIRSLVQPFSFLKMDRDNRSAGFVYSNVALIPALTDKLNIKKYITFMKQVRLRQDSILATRNPAHVSLMNCLRFILW